MERKRSGGVQRGRPRKATCLTRPAMMDWALRLLRLLNERKELTSGVVAEEFGVSLRTAQRYLVYLSAMPCVVADERRHTYSLVSDYRIDEKILGASETALVCALIDYAIHIFGREHSGFLAQIRNRIFRSPEVYQLVGEEAIDMRKVAHIQAALESHIKSRQVVSFSYRRSGKRYTVEPYRILYHLGFWYLVAGHQGTMKKFLLDYMEGVKPAGRKYDAVPDSVRKALAEAQTVWFHDTPAERVTVEFDAQVADFFERRSVLPRQKIVDRRKNGDVVVAFDAHNEMEAREYLGRWMPHFKVLSPDRYREYIGRIAGRTAEMHGGMAAV